MIPLKSLLDGLQQGGDDRVRYWLIKGTKPEKPGTAKAAMPPLAGLTQFTATSENEYRRRIQELMANQMYEASRYMQATGPPTRMSVLEWNPWTVW